jgi:hypothetical protein
MQDMGEALSVCLIDGLVLALLKTVKQVLSMFRVSLLAENQLYNCTKELLASLSILTNALQKKRKRDWYRPQRGELYHYGQI